ncbi:MAG: hypothetical protein WAM60_25490 [Candidatus Promineifilaceae bacterium]
MKKSRLMIVVGERTWTLAALHLACAISRRSGIDLLLLKMVPVQHPLFLGTTAGLLNYSDEDARILSDMAATAEDYGISLQVQIFQYASYWSGLVDAAGQLGATAVVVQVPSSFIPHLRDLRCRWLRHKLAGRQQLLFTLDDLRPSLNWTPTLKQQNNMAQLLEQQRWGRTL